MMRKIEIHYSAHTNTSATKMDTLWRLTMQNQSGPMLMLAAIRSIAFELSQIGDSKFDVAQVDYIIGLLESLKASK